ncbi:GNAT family N-acetyltransferase [Paenibacillus illinoisensis]|uniref:GNAT family N-acetyltransferase n=1 Tax=Paenibacillus illinoisensis TaxID=59845 RepID=UPI001C8D9B89|nr:GNAT family N-acetyltransferase [Paenibacillus illinoisensis]MBY0217752.1 GNAT family N-acetyltransferase [Paenibacillus illinoisensis]
MEYNIRLADKEDIRVLLSVRNNKALFTTYLNQQEKKEVYLLVAEINRSTILGFGLLKLNSNLSPKLSDLYVKENFRGNGIGSSLIRHREKLARKLGYSEIFVSVDPIGNPKMIKLITKHGYKRITEPYSKRALFHNEDGTTYEQTYTRVDLKRSLN